MSDCQHPNYDEYFNNCPDCGVKDLLPDTEEGYELQQKFEAYLLDYGREHGWSESYTRHAAQEIAAGLGRIAEESAA